ncbi:MAG: RagB/SusD family nutrient uptake outer membrane protein [Terrimonas sp.]|nr:RagB/SusD family nutrient uptake outer membrane protein [Terrimonas sp.]OJY97944.1 MAG: hypothetical protein BGP13_09770 [Sphingobacteriales bacterium 40-81]
MKNVTTWGINLTLATVAVLSVLVFAGCKKYLDKKADPQLVVPSTLKDIQALLDNTDEMNNIGSGLAHGSSDDFFAVNPHQLLNDGTLQAYTWQHVLYVSTRNDWSIPYNTVYVANLALDLLKDIPQNASNNADYKNAKGSALFFRSFCFSQLAGLYAKAYDEQTSNVDLGIPIRQTSDYNIPSVRATVKATYEQILRDAQEASSLLPDHPLHVTRPSKAAAYALLARTYLNMQNYDSAGIYADKCLQLKNDLMDFKTEIIASASAPFKMFNKETIFYARLGSTWLLNINTYVRVDTTLFSLYEMNDIRRQAFFASSGSYRTFKGNYTGSSGIRFTGIATDEIYLIRAECFARKENNILALNDLNKLLKHRYDASFQPIYTSSSNETLNIILTERRKELLYRTLRWMDIKRLNKDGRNIILKRVIGANSFTLNPNDGRYALTIPDEVVELTGMQQN